MTSMEDIQEIVWGEELQMSMGRFSRWQMMIFSYFSQKIRFWHFMQIVSYGDNLHEVSNPIF